MIVCSWCHKQMAIYSRYNVEGPYKLIACCGAARALKTAPEVAKLFSVAIILNFFLNNDPHM